MSDAELALRSGVPGGVVGEGNDCVADVVFDGVDIAAGRIYVHATVELDVGLGTGDDAAGFGRRRTRTRVVEPAEDADAPRVAVLQVHFVALHVDADRTEN